MPLEVTYGCKKIKTKDGETLYSVTTNSQKSFWSHEELRGGLIVDVLHKTAGEKYTASDGSEKTYLKSGLNLNYVIGTSAQAREISLAKVAIVECEL